MSNHCRLPLGHSIASLVSRTPLFLLLDFCGAFPSSVGFDSQFHMKKRHPFVLLSRWSLFCVPSMPAKPAKGVKKNEAHFCCAESELRWSFGLRKGRFQLDQLNFAPWVFLGQCGNRNQELCPKINTCRSRKFVNNGNTRFPSQP